MRTRTRAEPALQREIDRIVDALSGDAAGLAAAMVDNITTEIPPYLQTADAEVLEDVLAHCEAHAQLILTVARDARSPRREELAFAREAAVRRVRQRIPIEGLLAAFRVGHRTVWDAILHEAGEGPHAHEAAIALARPAMEYIDFASTHVAEAYTREEAKRRAAADRERRDLIEALLAGRVPAGAAARVAPGLEREDRLAVVVAALAAEAPGTDALVEVADALRIAGGEVAGPLLVVMRQRQVVLVAGTTRSGPAALVDGMRHARAALVRRDVDIRVGVATECSGLRGVAHAHTEAVRALGRTTDAEPVLALQEMTAFDYLVASADAGARQVILDKGRALLEADEREGGAVSETLLAYVACDLNVRRTALHLDVHPNTVRYRLRRLAELTDSDARRFGDLLELVTIVRTARS